MVQTRNMHEHEAEHVRDLWLQMCKDLYWERMSGGAGTPGLLAITRVGK